jgi:hypothetical protein
MVMKQKQEQTLDKKKKTHTVFGMVGGKATPQDKKKPVKIKKKPTCLILDEIDQFFNNDPRAQWKLLNFLYRNKSQNQIEELFSDESKVNKELATKRPIIMIGENMYGKGLRAFRRGCVVFRVYKNHDIVYKKVSQVCHEEKIDLANDIIAKVCKTFKDHLGAILNFLDMIRKGAATSRTEVLNLLSRTSVE